MIQVVTSFSPEGYSLYGCRFIDTFEQHWPWENPQKNLSLVVYTEDAEFPGPWGKVRNLLNVPWCKEFLDQHKNNQTAKGYRTPKYNFREDTWKFCRKVFALNDAAEKLNGDDILIWIDADSFTFADVPLSDVKSWLPNGYAYSYLARPGYHSECGFMMFDLSAMRKFLLHFAFLYKSGEVFELKEWHDSWVFDWLRKKLRMDIYGYDLNQSRSRADPFDLSPVGQYMKHLKGAKKYERS